MSAIALPDSLGALLDDVALLGAITEALSPPQDRRVRARIEVEVESDDDGTFTLLYEDGAVTADEGMADEPWLAARVPAGGYALVRELLDAALAGFPRLPRARALQESFRRASAQELAQAHAGLDRVRGVCVRVVVSGVGTYTLARGAVDEAVRSVDVTLPAAAIRKALLGDVGALAGQVRIAGERRVLQDLALAGGVLAAPFAKALSGA